MDGERLKRKIEGFKALEDDGEPFGIPERAIETAKKLIDIAIVPTGAAPSPDGEIMI